MVKGESLRILSTLREEKGGGLSEWQTKPALGGALSLGREGGPIE